MVPQSAMVRGGKSVHEELETWSVVRARVDVVGRERPVIACRPRCCGTASLPLPEPARLRPRRRTHLWRVHRVTGPAVGHARGLRAVRFLRCIRLRSFRSVESVA
ncbi:hypothetical protein SGPA1_40361 [Streptomyces misionensis JCM 4497]